MSVYRVNKTRDFTVMGNTHLRDKNLSLKAVGLLSKMLSFNDGWQFSTRGLAAICKEGPDAILSALKELEKNGYLVRHRGRDSKGRLVTTEFDIYESPQAGLPHREKPHRENPDVDSPDVENPHRDNPAQINTIQVINQERNTLSMNYQSINLDGMDRMDERSEYEEIIKENLDYDILCQDPKFDKDRFREIMDIMLDAVCSTAPTIRINGADMPQQVVKSRFLKLNSSHIEYVLEAMNKNPSDIRNIRAYLLTALYNASLTIDNYYSALVNHDFYGQDRLAGSKKPKTYDYSLAGLSNDAKVLYALMLDRASISKVNGFLETDGTIRIYFTVEQAQKKLHRSRQCATRIFHELEFSGLICRKKQGLGKPALITLNYPSNAKLIQPKKGSSILSG